MLTKKFVGQAAALASALVLAGCGSLGAGGLLSTGKDASASKGGAAGSTSVEANAELERCDAPLGTIAMDDGREQDWYYAFGAATKVTTIEPLLRLAVQQSNCFVITSIGNTRTESKISQLLSMTRTLVLYASLWLNLSKVISGTNPAERGATAESALERPQTAIFTFWNHGLQRKTDA